MPIKEEPEDFLFDILFIETLFQFIISLFLLLFLFFFIFCSNSNFNSYEMTKRR